ncbi:MAG TPA: CehA/McbA family metallohydrolase [Vicinamibacterales bacterium]|nr:CehA/McbA family metallohydrolase [Vicinamibacterales bacterium]
MPKRRIVRNTSIAAALAVGLAAAITGALLPPRAVASSPPTWHYAWPVVRGAYHVHSTKSDGTGSLDEIAQAAAHAGLQFIILTDHGDGTRRPEPPSYRAGVLCMDAVEVSTQYGHYVAIGLPQMPFRLAGHPRDVIEDVHRFGGFGIAAHPASAKAMLRWDDWDAPFDGLEWLNADSEWRDEFWTSMGRALLTYAFRPTETLASLLDRPASVLAQWDRLSRQRHVIGLAGSDAHARLGFRYTAEPYDTNDRFFVRLPSYETSFRTFSNHVVLDGPLTGDAAFDASKLLGAIRKGRLFTSIDGLAALGAFEVKAVSGSRFARAGEYIDSPEAVQLEADIAAPEGTRLVVFRDGVSIYDTGSSKLRVDLGTEPGAYRVEAHLPDSLHLPSVPWLVANPIYVNLASTHARAVVPPALPQGDVRIPVATQSWHSESDGRSSSVLSAGSLPDGTRALQWRLRLAKGPAFSQFAAIGFPVDRGVQNDWLQLRGMSNRPMRFWAQLRAPAVRGGERWAKSIFLGPTLSTVDLRLADFRPIGATSSEHPAFDRIESLLLVVDTLNTLPGTDATISIADLWLVR